MPEHDGTKDRFVVESMLILTKHGHSLVFAERHLAFLRLDLSRQNLQKGGFSRTVRSDNAVTIALGELDINVFEQLSAAELQTDSRNL